MGKNPLLNTLAAIAIFAVFAADNLSACSCITIPLRRRFMAATHVFEGTFTSVAPDTKWSPERATLRVNQWFLGPRTTEVSLEIAGGLCSTSQPRVGNRALIFATLSHDGTVVEKGCASVSLNNPASQRELAELRRKAWIWRLRHQFIRRKAVVH